jgi:Bestrophin, RFP-TM, chloride channel
MVPFALYDPFSASWNHIAMIPATAILSVFLFGIEELATQLEEPFTILPMQAFCDKIYNWCMEIMTWSPGDNGTRVKQVKPEHAYFVSVPAPNAKFDQMTEYVAQPRVPEMTVQATLAEPVKYTPPPIQPVQERPIPRISANEDAPVSFADFLKSQKAS